MNNDETRDFLFKYSLFIFDADGTLRETTIPKQPCPNTPEEWRLRPNVAKWFAEYMTISTRWGIASNQMGVKLGILSHDMAYQLLRDLADSLGGVPAEAIKMCPDNDPLRRKPAPGMLNEIMAFYHMRQSETLYIGDTDSDREAAAQAGVDFIHPDELFTDDAVAENEGIDGGLREGQH